MVSKESGKQKRAEKRVEKKDVAEIVQHQIRKARISLYVLLHILEEVDFRFSAGRPGRFVHAVIHLVRQAVLCVKHRPVQTEESK